MASGNFKSLTRKHGVKICVSFPCSVESIGLAVGEKVGHSCVVSAARMNSAVVVFLEKVNSVVETGITVNGCFVQVLPLSQPATKVVLSNVPPFITDEFLSRELSRHRKTAVYDTEQPERGAGRCIRAADSRATGFSTNISTERRGCDRAITRELPRISLLQKSPSSPVSCHATGFYPDSATLFWRREGEELHEDVYHGEVLPNHDGTFQMSADLKVSSISSEDWRSYDCVFQISGVKEVIVTKLDKDSVESNRVRSGRVQRLGRAAPWPLRDRVHRHGRAAPWPLKGKVQEPRPQPPTWGRNRSWHREDLRHQNQSGVCQDPPARNRSMDWSRDLSWHHEDLRRRNQSGVCWDHPARDRDRSVNWSWHREDLRRRNTEDVSREPLVRSRHGSRDRRWVQSWHREDLRRRNTEDVSREPPARSRHRSWVRSWHCEDLRRRNTEDVSREPPARSRHGNRDRSWVQSWHREDLRRRNTEDVSREPPAQSRHWSRDWSRCWSRRRCEDH